jgi:S-adenosylmethionine synthetase
MQTIDTFDTATVGEKQLEDFKNKLIDTSVHGIIEKLELKQPIYSKTSAYGHFGKADLPWEQIIA